MSGHKHSALSILMILLMIPTLIFTAPAPFAFAEGENSGTDTADFQMSLPVMNIHIDESRGTIDAMNQSEDHSVHCYGTMDITVPEGFSYVDGEEGTVLSDLKGLSIDMRGRGNSTWMDPDKKPYKIKLDEAADILGMGANKHWAILAFSLDDSMMRNRITYWLGHQLGMAYTPDCCPVDVFVDTVTDDGYSEPQYYGSYLLCETIRLDPNRIEIDQLKKKVNSEPELTGGYLMSVIQDSATPAEFCTDRSEYLQNVDPSFDPDDGGYENDTQKEYIRDYVNEAEDAVMDGWTEDESSDKGYRELDYRDYFDVDAAVDYWLMQEFSMDHDAYTTGSNYFYKTRDKDGEPGKIFWGPLWDFDQAWGNMEDDEYTYFSSDFSWMNALLTRTETGGFNDQVRSRWPEYKRLINKIVEPGGIIDQYYEEIRVSQECDFEQYRKSDSEVNDFKESVERLRAWIIGRRDWFEDNLDELDNYICTYEFKEDADDETVTHRYSRRGFDYNTSSVDDPVREGYIFLGWFDEDGKQPDFSGEVDEDKTYIARWISKEDAVKADDIRFAVTNARVALHDQSYSPSYTLLPLNTQDKTITWSSSDSSVASVDEEGSVTLHTTGKVRITAVTSGGVKRSYTLNILDSVSNPQSITVRPDSLEMEPGEMAFLSAEVFPDDAGNTSLLFESEDEDVATVDDNGIVIAKKKGKTRISVTVTFFSKDCEWMEFTDYCDVTVGLTVGTPKIRTRTRTAVRKMIVKWSKVGGATGYIAQYRQVGSGTWKTKKTSASSVKFSGMKKGKLYQFRTAAVRKASSGSNQITGKYSRISYRYYQGMKRFRAKAKKKSIRLTWKKISGASGYLVRISENKDFSDYKLIKVNKGSAKGCTIKGLKSGKTYYVRVRPFMKKGGKTYTGILSGIRKIRVK